jgi:hypothetical protein
MARFPRVALVSLRSGELVDVAVLDGFVFDKLTLHQSLAQLDLLCSMRAPDEQKSAIRSRSLRESQFFHRSMLMHRRWI